MEYEAKSYAERPFSEIEKRTAVSVRKDFCEARRSGSLSFSGAVGSESFVPNALRFEEVADMRVEARTSRVIPPPPVPIWNTLRISRVSCSGFSSRSGLGRGSFLFPV